MELLARAQAGQSTLLIAPTGAGKTLAGFLPALSELAGIVRPKPGSAGAREHHGIHTLYISPLKALAVDIKRNLETPIAEMGLDIKVETRTGDTPTHRRQRQKHAPPDILLTTPEQLSLLIANKDAGHLFARLKYVVFDELHSLVTSKRGHMLALALARLRKLRGDAGKDLQTIGLSATVSNPSDLCRWLVGQNRSGVVDDAHEAGLVTVKGGAKPHITILDSQERLPWSGHSARHAVAEIYDVIKQYRTSILFVNTRSQAEFLFQNLWRINDDNLPIALHHGSLDVAQRRRVEAAMSINALRAVVATSTLDLGIDWGDVDLVLHIGAPKGASRLAQRIGRANHRMDEPSRAVLVPANRFEVMECQAALDANYLGDQDTPPMREGALDVLCQHIFGMAVAGPFTEEALFDEIISAAPYAQLDWDSFERCVHFVATGGYALATYERYAKIRKAKDGSWRLTHPRFAQQYRMNAGTIYEAPSMTVRLLKFAKRDSKGLMATRGGRVLGKLEEYFLEQMVYGDTFMFGGQIVRFEGIRENEAIVTPTVSKDPMVPMYAGAKFPLTTYLAEHIRAMIADPEKWKALPTQVSHWLEIQQLKSVLPRVDQMLVETFPRGDKFYLVAYTFEGRIAHQTLGMLLTKRLERVRARPTGFVATDYSICIWGLDDIGALLKSGKLSLDALFEEDMLGDDLESWMEDSFMLKRTFRQCALIAGLIEKNYPGKEKSGRQVTISTDLIYDVLREHEPDHILMQATREDAASGLLDIHRVGGLLARIKGHIVHKNLDRVSPLAVPIMLEIGRESVPGEANDTLLAEAAEQLITDAMGEPIEMANGG